MKILVVSDTHGDAGNLKYVAGLLGPTLDLLIHLGDGTQDLEKLPQNGLADVPRLLVKGNMDSAAHLPPSRTTEVRGRILYASHGHGALASGSLLPLILAARQAGAEVCLFGHTHIPQRTQTDGMLVINPGSLSRPRGGWAPTFALLTVPEDGDGRIEAVHYEILNSGKRPSLRVLFL